MSYQKINYSPFVLLNQRTLFNLCTYTRTLDLEHTDAYSLQPVHIEMEQCSDVRFKQRAVIEFLTAEQVPPIEIQRRMQAI